MKVYVVTAGYSYEGSEVVAVFSNEEAAEEQVKRTKKAHSFYDHVSVEEWEVEDDAGNS